MDRRTVRASLVTVAVVALCLWPRAWMPFRESTHPPGHADKLVHFAMFAAFGALWAAAGRPSWSRSAVVLAVGLALGGWTEWAQGHPAIGRDADPLDALADALGTCAGVAWVMTRRPSSEPETRAIEAAS